MKLKKLKIVNGQNHLANRNHKECKRCIQQARRRFANLISADKELKVPLRCVNAANLDCSMQLSGVNAADEEWKVPPWCVNAAVSAKGNAGMIA